MLTFNGQHHLKPILGEEMVTSFLHERERVSRQKKKREREVTFKGSISTAMCNSV